MPKKSPNDILKQKIYITIYGANTFWGRMYDIGLLIVILFSILLVMLESVRRYDQDYHDLLIIGEYVVTVLFTIEYFLRIYSHKKPLQYIFSFYGIIDLISLLPMYLSPFIPYASYMLAFRSLRLLRIFAILDAMSILKQQWHIKEALRSSKDKILVFIYFMTVISIVLGTIMYMIEGPKNGFTSIPTSIYWCIVTMTTVGYGDIAPATTLGKFIATIIMVLGYGIIAVPTGIVTSEVGKLKKSSFTPDHVGNTCKRCFTKAPKSEDNYCAKCGELLK